jgi:hypothetical protein
MDCNPFLVIRKELNHEPHEKAAQGYAQFPDRRGILNFFHKRAFTEFRKPITYPLCGWPCCSNTKLKSVLRNRPKA